MEQLLCLAALRICGRKENWLFIYNKFTQAVEIKSIDSSDSVTVYQEIVSLDKLKYYCLQGTSTSLRGESAQGPSPHDFVIDSGEFDAALKFLTARDYASSPPSE